MNRPRQKISPSSYHGSCSDFRNIAIPKKLHTRIAHIAIDLEISISEITSTLVEEFCKRVETGQFDIGVWRSDTAAYLEAIRKDAN